MLYYLYKIVNNKNGNYYIGRRAFKGTLIDDDTYMGSGIRIKAAIKKYGIENFRKSILGVFENEEQLIEAEKREISAEMVNSTECYNIAFGGNGGYTYYKDRDYKHSVESKQKISNANKNRKRPDVIEHNLNSGFNKIWLGKKRTAEDKKKKSIAAEKSIIEGRHSSKIIVTCPYCTREMSIANAKRWHFDKCKEKI